MPDGKSIVFDGWIEPDGDLAYRRSHIYRIDIDEVEYESLVADQEGQTRRLLDRLGLDFEERCLRFDENKSASTTASSVQVRQKVHTGSVNKWKRFETQLKPLRDYLESAGIDVQ
jgi:hypothetical protein